MQQGNANDMVFNFDDIIHHVSKFMTLKIGDILFTGTPAGVGAVEKNDKLEGFIHERKAFSVTVK